VYFAYGHYYLQVARPAVGRPGECRSNVEIFRALAKRMGFTDPCFDETEDEMLRALLDTQHPFLSGITLERLDREHFVRLKLGSNGDPFLPFANGFPTATGKCDLLSVPTDFEPPVESRGGDAGLRARYPLELVAAKNDDSMNSTFGNRDGTDRQTAVLEMHPEDAVPRGIATGDPVRVFNGRGASLLVAQVGDSVARGVVAAPSVRWPSRSPGGHGINELTSERVTDIGGGATFYSCLVQVERIGD
jgi:anaerobic selenocysteine-containing dehydrogenase